MFSDDTKATDVGMQQIRALFYPCVEKFSAGNRGMFISPLNKMLNLHSNVFHTVNSKKSKRKGVCIFF